MSTNHLFHYNLGRCCASRIYNLKNGITLPADDPFWREYYPPNGWRCRCTTVEVNKGKYPVSDSKEAQRIGQLL